MPLTITGLSKTYSNGVQALKDLNLTIGNNMFGLLGPNGAGKSTLMRTIATLQEPDSGEIWLDDINVVKQKETVRRLLGYLPQEFGVYPKISAARHAQPPRRDERRHQQPANERRWSTRCSTRPISGMPARKRSAPIPEA